MNLPRHGALACLAILTTTAAPACGPAPTTSPDAAASGPANPSVDAIFADLDRDGPGAAVGVVFGGEVVHRAGYGMAHLDHGIPVTPGTVFDIASVSKQFGAMAALLLEAEGRLDLDADVGAYVPGLPEFGAVVTPRHLIHHTSGIRDWPHLMALAGVEMSDVISFEKIMRMLDRQQTLNFPPGSEYAYSNTGYNLLAKVVEEVSGKTFREYVDEQIFRPLGMSRTHFSDDYLEVVPGRAESYAPAEGREGVFRRQPNQLTALASSSLHTTIDDFVRWMQNYDTGRAGGHDVLRAMLRQGVLSNGDTIAYAGGLTVGEHRGLPVFGHGGSWAGYRTYFARFPEQRLSVAVFCNVSDCDPAGRARKVAEAYLEDEMDPAPTPEEGAEPEAAAPTPPEASLQEYAGEYRSPELDTSYDVAVEDGRLVATHWRNPASVLVPSGPDAFAGDRWWFPEVQFLRDAAGQVIGFEVNGARVRNLVFERQAAASGRSPDRR